jgi:membrane associated rhomboid family serine protease
VREQARSGRTGRTVFGGRAGGTRPLVTQAIIVGCVIIFLFQWGDPRVTDELSFAPYEAVAQPYRFLTSAFLHSPSFVLHIVMNMYALWVLGPYLESLLGRLRFAALYLWSAIGGSVGYFVLVPPSDQGWTTGALGASGAVFGLFSAVLVINRRLGRETGGVVGVILINLVLGFWQGFHIAWQAHLGGLVTGAAVSLLLARRTSANRGVWQLAGLAGVALLLAGLTIIKILAVPAGMLA